MSYAEFSWSDLTVAADSISCTVKNTASRTGSVVAQLYLVKLDLYLHLLATSLQRVAYPELRVAGVSKVGR